MSKNAMEIKGTYRLLTPLENPGRKNRVARSRSQAVAHRILRDAKQSCSCQSMNGPQRLRVGCDIPAPRPYDSGFLDMKQPGL